MIRAGMICSFSNPSAQIPIINPNMQNVSEVKIRKNNITNGCFISSGTKKPAVINMSTPKIMDFVAAAPT